MEDEDDDDEWDRDLAIVDVLNEASIRLEDSYARDNTDPFEAVLRDLEVREQKFKDFEELLHEESDVNKFDIENLACPKGEDGGRSCVLQTAKALLDTCERRTKYSSANFAASEREDAIDEVFLDDPAFIMAQQRRNLVEEFKAHELERRIEKEACRQQKNEAVTKELALIEAQKTLFLEKIENEQQRKLEEIGNEGELALRLIEEQSEIEQQNLMDNVYAYSRQDRRGMRKFSQGYQDFNTAVYEAMVGCETQETTKVDESKTDRTTTLGERKEYKETENRELTGKEDIFCLKTLNTVPMTEDLALDCLPVSIDDYFSRASRDDLCSIFQECIRNIEQFGISSVVSQFPVCLQRVVENIHRVLVCEVNLGYDVGNLLSRKFGPRYETLTSKEDKAAVVHKRISRLIGKVLKLSVTMVGSSLPLTRKWKGLEKEAKQVGAQLALVHNAKQSTITNDGATSIFLNGKLVAAFKLDFRGRMVERMSHDKLRMIEGSLKPNEEVQLDEVKKSWETFEAKKLPCVELVDDKVSPQDDRFLVRCVDGLESVCTGGNSWNAESSQSLHEGCETSSGVHEIGDQRSHGSAETSSTQEAEDEEADTRRLHSLCEKAEEAETQESQDGVETTPSQPVAHNSDQNSCVTCEEEAETYSEQAWEEEAEVTSEKTSESWEKLLLDPEEETDSYSEQSWEEDAGSSSDGRDRKILLDDVKLQVKATKIQASVRGFLCKRRYRRLRDERRLKLICRLQAVWRGLRIRKLEYLPSLKRLKAIHENSATKIQALWRGFTKRTRFKRALSKSKYVDNDDFDYECIDCILFAMEDTRTYEQDEASLIVCSAVLTKEEPDKGAQAWDLTSNTRVMDLDFESSGTSPIVAEDLPHQTAAPMVPVNLDSTVAPQHVESVDHAPVCTAAETEQKKKDFMSAIARDWGFKNEKTVRQFMKACSKKRPSKDDGSNSTPLQDIRKRRSKK